LVSFLLLRFEHRVFRFYTRYLAGLTSYQGSKYLKPTWPAGSRLKKIIMVST
jgi:hypothetical protein